MAESATETAVRKSANNKKYTGIEPVWDTVRAEKFSEDEFRSHLIASLNYYNYNFLTKDLRKHLNLWLKECAKAGDYGITTEIVSQYLKTPDSYTTMTACALVKANTQGMPLKPDHAEYIVKIVTAAISKHQENSEPVVEETKAKPATKQPTIQDRLRDIMNEHILYFDILEDSVIAGEKLDPKAYEYLITKQVPQNILTKMSNEFAARAAELADAKAGVDEQLKEGYRHLTAADYKRFAEFYKKIIEDISKYSTVKKATKKARAKKSPTKAKLIAKLKYLKEDSKQALVSINPAQIIGARKLWIYNVKTRKLGCYVADELSGGLGVKGTSIQDFDVVASVQKTLRKPEQQLKEFGKAGKVALRKFLQDIKAVEIKLNGRINADTVLLKVE